MWTIDGVEIQGALSGNTQIHSEPSNTSSTISAHCTFIAVGIEVLHVEMVAARSWRFKQHQAVCTHTIVAVTPLCNGSRIQRKSTRAIINENEIVSSTVVFVKFLVSHP
jgi:hypothetical protein